MPRIDEDALDLAELLPFIREADAGLAPPAIPLSDGRNASAPPLTPVSADPKRLAPQKIRIKLEPESQSNAERLTPANIKSWSSSLVLHAILLCLLAIMFFKPVARKVPVIETVLAPGDVFGSDFGQQLTGGKGLDEPLAMPYEPEKTFESQPVLTDSVALEPSLVVPERSKVPDPESSASGGGVALTGTGQAGKGDGFGVAKFGFGGKESINNVEVKTGNPQFTLIWDSDADLDLHVLEPGGSHLYWENRHGANGGELDVDDVDGLGPENVFWGGGLNQGNGPPGEYRWYVHYYGNLRGNSSTKWRVRVKYNGTYKVFEGKLNAIGQRTKTYSFKIEKSDTNPESETTKPDGDNQTAPASGRSRPLGGEPAAFDNPTSMLSGGLGRTRAGVDQVVNDGGMVEPAQAPGRAAGNRPAASAESKPESEKLEGSAKPDVKRGEPATEPADSRPAGRPRTGVERDSSGWVKVRPVGLGFNFLMPEAPAEETQVLENRPDEPEIRVWKLNRGEGEFICAVAELPKGSSAEGVGPLLDREARLQAAEAGGTEVVSGNDDTRKIPGRSLKFKVPDRIVAGGGISRMRLLVQGGYLIRLSVTGTEEFVDRADTRRFLESFAEE